MTAHQKLQIDGVDFEIPNKHMTAHQILELVGLAAAEFGLFEATGSVPIADDLEVLAEMQLELRPGTAFVTRKKIHYTVDGKPQSTHHQQLTANQILKKAGHPPADNALVEIKGNQRVSYEGRGETEVPLHDGAKFETVRLIHYTVDADPQTTSHHVLTANQILENAGLSSADHYLVEVKGHERISFQGKGNEPIELRNGMRFVSVFVGPTPVSDADRTGLGLFLAELRRLGFDPTDHGSGQVSFDYTVDVGRFAGKTYRLGFAVPSDFPLTPPSGPHVNPRIHANQGGGSHPTGGIHDSPFGAGWQYWSRPCNDWPKTRRRVADYMAFVRQLWATQ